MQRRGSAAAAADPRDGKAGRRRAELLFRYRSDLCLGRSMAPPAAAAASWITPSSLPAWGSGLSRRSTSRRRTALFIGWTCACGRLATAGRWCSALRRWKIITGEQGRDWERYAMVKARIMGDNDGAYASELRAMLRPFVFPPLYRLQRDPVAA